MKISAIITTILVAQVSASFFDVFHSAVLSVQNSFGKLLSDVVTDVKETVDCTILAVEHVLSLSHDATQRYYDKCGSVTNKTDSVSEDRHDANVPKVEDTFNLPNNSEYLQNIPAEIDARMNETLSKVLGNYKPSGNVLSIENVLAKETEQLADVSVLVKKELDKLSHEVTTDLKKIEKQRDSGPSVDTIIQEIKVLEKREQNTKNSSEASEIHQVIVQVLGRLDSIEATEANENIKLEEILKDLESNSSNSFVGLRQQFEEWKEEESRHLIEIKSKIEDHEKIFDHPESYNRQGSNHPQPVLFNIDMNRDNADRIKKIQEISNDNTTQAKEKLDNNTSSRKIGDSNDKSLISVANEPSSFQNNTFNESGLKNIVITITLFSTTESPFGSKIIHPFETPTAVGSNELATLSTNQSTTPQNNLTRNDTNETIKNTTLGIINSAPVNETMPPVVLLANLDKQESTSVTANEPTTILSTNENNSNETVTVSNPLQLPEITAIKDAILPVKRNTDSGKEEASDFATNNDTVIISAAETVVTEMTSTSHSNNNSKDIVISSIANTMVENTSVNATNSETVESSTSATNELVTTRIITFDVIVSNDTNFSTPVNVTILPTESSTATVTEESSTVTARIISDNDSNNTMLPSTSSPNLERTPISETIQPEETTLASGKDQSTTELYDTKISSTSLPNVKNTPVSATQPEETGTTCDNEKSSTFITKIVNDNDSKFTMITSDSSLIVEKTSVSATVEPEETTVSGNEEFSNDSNGTMITSTYLPITESTLIHGTIQPNETTMASSNKEFSTETTSQLTTISKVVNEHDSDTSITSTPTPIKSTSESETSQVIDTTTVSTSDEKSLGSTANSSTRTPNTANDDDDNSSPDVVTMTPEKISESILQENITASENGGSASTTNSPIASPATLIDTNSNNDAITSTTSLTEEITTDSEIIEPVESITPTKNEEPSILSTTPATIPDKVTNENTDSNDTVTSTTENADSVAVTDIIQTVEYTKAPEEQELSSTSTITQSVINEIVTTSTVFPSIESISTNENITASRNEEDLKNSPKLEANTSRSPEILYSPDLNFRVRTPPLVITESAPVNREWLTSKTANQQNYDTNGTPRNNFEFNAPILLSDRLLQTRQPLINPEVPMYGQAAPPITRSLFNGASTLLTPDRLIPNVPNQQRKIENDEVQQAAFAFFDSVDERLSHSDSPFGPEADILKIANIPSTPAPRKPIDPQKINYENPSFVPTPKHPTGPPDSFGDKAPADTYRPQGLTTHRPKKTAASASNYKSPPMDYDSFFHSPPRDSEAHQRALKEARQLIANSKRSDRIINRIMKNKNKFKARSVFG